MKLCDIYGIKDILRTFGYNGYKEDGSIQLNMHEIGIVEKYRSLDSTGQSHVDAVLQWETERVQQIEQATATPAATRIINWMKMRGDCEVYPALFAVFLNEDDRNYVEPDISVICNKDRLNDKGCNGAPDWIIEIVSPSTECVDYGIKLFKYRSAGVREYWVVNPRTHTVNVYDFEHEKGTRQYSFDDEAPVCIYNNDLAVRIADLV